MQLVPANATLAHVRSPYLTTLLTLGLAACATPDPADRPVPSIIAEPQTKADIWRGIATEGDKQRIARLGLAWQEALQ